MRFYTLPLLPPRFSLGDDMLLTYTHTSARLRVHSNNSPILAFDEPLGSATILPGQVLGNRIMFMVD